MADTPRVLSHRGKELLANASVNITDERRSDAESKLAKLTAGRKLDLTRNQVDSLISFEDNLWTNYKDWRGRNRAFREVLDLAEAARYDEVPARMRKILTGDETEAVARRLETEIALWHGTRDSLLSPKLRMIANGDDDVNGNRALLSSCVSSDTGGGMDELALAKAGVAPEASGAESSAKQASKKQQKEKDSTPGAEEPVDRGLSVATGTRVSCFVHLVGSGSESTIEAKELSVQDLERIRAGQAPLESMGGTVAYVETGSPVAPPIPEIGAAVATLTDKQRSRLQQPNTSDSAGKNLMIPRRDVIVGIIDVGGFDFTHEDFVVKHNGEYHTKFLALWDQGLINRSGHYPWNTKLAMHPLNGTEDLLQVPGIGEVYSSLLRQFKVTSRSDLALMCESARSELWDALKEENEMLGDDQFTQWMKAVRSKPITVPYGAIYEHGDLVEAFRLAEEHKLEPTDFVTQTIQEPGSHGTHVASIAAGNSGVCPNAWIVGVTIAMGEQDSERRASFYDSTRLSQAVEFIVDVAHRARLPVSINISLGTNGHAHDGTSPINKKIESALQRQGRVVCVAAGNAGKETADNDGDIGFMSGRIHTQGRIKAKDLVVEVTWQVVGNGIVDVSENELEIWYNPGDDFAVQVRSPSGEESDWIPAGGFLENWRTRSNTFLSIYSERFVPANGANRIALFLSPKLKDGIVGVEPGVWTVRLKGTRIRDGRFDAWIERDDPGPIGSYVNTAARSFPSYFTIDSNVDAKSINSLGCGPTVIAVANVGRGGRINSTSSQGPTRDGRQKPDIAAPGTNIQAARGFATYSDRWIEMTGTSMASPYVAGVAANMLIKDPSLTAGQILGIIRSTAQPLPGADYAWRDDAGYGVIDQAACLEEVGNVFATVESKGDQGG